MSELEKNPIPARILAFATQGANGNDEMRLRVLLQHLDASFFPFDKEHKFRCAWTLLKTLVRQRPELAIMEGTGLAGGLPLILASLLFGVRFVFSSGDAVGPWVRAHNLLAAPFFSIYERVLCRNAAGFIGWSSYLVGRALTFGARHAVTAPGWPLEECLNSTDGPRWNAARQEIRSQLGLPAQVRVVGIAGALNWNSRRQYCYGLELVEAMLHLSTVSPAHNWAALIVGDGSGMAKLKERAGGLLGHRIFLPGQVPRADLRRWLAAMDVASLPQSVDKVGVFRYTTKLADYVGAGLPAITTQIPMAYDLCPGGFWRVRGRAPWTLEFTRGVADLLRHIGAGEVEEKARAMRAGISMFDRDSQVARVTAFLKELLGNI